MNEQRTLGKAEQKDSRICYEIVYKYIQFLNARATVEHFFLGIRNTK